MNRRPPVGSLVLALLSLPALLPLTASGSLAQEYHVDPTAERSARFISQAPIDEFEGVTDRIDGYVLLDRARLDSEVDPEKTQFYFEVDLASLDTGIGLRDRQMRDNYLEVEQHPYATLSGSLTRVSASVDGSFGIEAAGTMGIHGVERPIAVPCEVVPRSLSYRVHCAFQVLLSDYDIKIPSVMFLKLANEIRLELDFEVRPAGIPRMELSQ